MVAGVVTGGSSDGGDSRGEQDQGTITEIIEGSRNLPYKDRHKHLNLHYLERQRCEET